MRVSSARAKVFRLSEAIKAAVIDGDGNKAVVSGPAPQKAIRQSVKEDIINDQFRKTGGTPYFCEDAQSRVGEGLYIPVSVVNDLRRKLLSNLSAERAKVPSRRSLPIPEMPQDIKPIKDPVTIYHVRTAEQMTKELAELRPEYLYVPVDVMAENTPLLKPFKDNGVTCVAVLPRVITDEQTSDVHLLA